MKLIQELLSLREEAIETELASDIWKENKDNTKTYITTAVYYVKDGEDGEKEVYQDKDGKRKLLTTLDSSELDGSYVPVRADQKKDVEGYTTWRDADEIEAFKYEGDTVKVDLEGETGKLKKGDYLIRSSEGDNFVYSIETAKNFEDDYAEKK